MRDLRIAVTLLILGLLTLSVVPWEATATTTITTFGVTATVEAMCLMSATSGMSKTPREAAKEVTELSTVTVTCTNSTPYTVGFSDSSEDEMSAPNRPWPAPAPKAPLDDPGSALYWLAEGAETSRPKAAKGIGNGSSQAFRFSRPCNAGQPYNSNQTCETITAIVTY